MRRVDFALGMSEPKTRVRGESMEEHEVTCAGGVREETSSEWLESRSSKLITRCNKIAVRAGAEELKLSQ